MILSEQYRPRTWGDVVGQEKVIAKIESLRPRGLGGRAYWIAGQSGTGKTTIARLLASELADEFCTDEVDAEGLSSSRVRDIERESRCRGFDDSGRGRTGRAYIVNDAHGLRRHVVRQLLVTLEPERIASHVVWVFTTTNEGEAVLFDGAEDAHPLLSRCVELRLSRQGLAQPFAARAQAIATEAGLNGRPIGDYVKLLQGCKNNLRMAIQKIEAGEMLVK